MAVIAPMIPLAPIGGKPHAEGWSLKELNDVNASVASVKPDPRPAYVPVEHPAAMLKTAWTDLAKQLAEETNERVHANRG